jgi:adenylyltransferase/sulfurtransferase
MESGVLSPRELRRYGKQIMLPDVGIDGQQKLKGSSVLVVGAGGLGCPALQYLAAAGIGNLGIVEFDRVDEANLQRQVLYGSPDMGKLKSIIARERLENLNPIINLSVNNIRLDRTNALSLAKDFDIIVDATDNTETRYLINDTCVILGKPMVHGAIFRHEGEVAVFNYKGGATYRCFNPSGNTGNYLNPSPAESGLFGVLPGIAGTLMANEVIKIVTGTGTVLNGIILIFNIMSNSFRTFSVKNNPENHIITTL